MLATNITLSFNINYKTFYLLKVQKLPMKCQQHLVTTYGMVMRLCSNISSKFAYTHPTSHVKTLIIHFIPITNSKSF